MRCQKYLSYLGALSLALSAELVPFFQVTPPLRAQPLEVSLSFPPVENRGTLSRTAGGGTRRRGATASCVTGNTPLTALAPSNNVGTTVLGSPTLFWYVPETKAESAEFEVVDAQGKNVYLTTLALNGTPGVVNLNLPKTVSLEPGKEYTWQLALVCNPLNRRQDMFVRGKLKRTELSSEHKTQLAAATEPLKQAEVYAEAKVWQETLMILAQLYRDRPNDSHISEAWKELLQSVQLEAIATKPLVECCKAENALQ